VIARFAAPGGLRASVHVPARIGLDRVRRCTRRPACAGSSVCDPGQHRARRGPTLSPRRASALTLSMATPPRRYPARDGAFSPRWLDAGRVPQLGLEHQEPPRHLSIPPHIRIWMSASVRIDGLGYRSYFLSARMASTCDRLRLCCQRAARTRVPNVAIPKRGCFGAAFRKCKIDRRVGKVFIAVGVGDPKVHLPK